MNKEVTLEEIVAETLLNIESVEEDLRRVKRRLQEHLDTLKDE